MNRSSLTRRAWLALAAAGLAGPLHAQPGAVAREPIKLALIEGLSGAFANAGDAVARNIQWAGARRRGC